MFTARRSRNIFEAALSTLALIYHVTVYNLRKDHRNAVVGLLMTILQSSVFILGFLGFYLIMKVRHSPIGGDFVVFAMSGIFPFMVFSQAMAAIASAGAGSGTLLKHGPLSTAVLIGAAGLAVLYRMTITILIVLWFYHTLFSPVELYDPLGCYMIVLLAWFVGGSIGLVLLSLRPRFPQGIRVITQLLQRINMVASGKMFVANLLPGFMLKIFAWNPLFHIVDQMRGYAYLNYTPHKTSLSYAFYVGLSVLMVGLMAEFVTRNSTSLSTSAGK